MDGCGHRLENVGFGFLVPEHVYDCPVCREYMRDKLQQWKDERKLTGRDPHEGEVRIRYRNMIEFCLRLLEDS